MKSYDFDILVFIQELYEKYSSLVFSHASDRAVAIWGIQKRLDKASKEKDGENMVRQPFLSRSLLWQRNQAKPMKRITHSSGLRVPSWSWLSREGAIKYKRFQVGTTDWEMAFSTNLTQEESLRKLGTMGYIGISSRSSIPTVRAEARNLNNTMEEHRGKIIFDEKDDFKISNLMCVALGKTRGRASLSRTPVYCLIIHKADSMMKEFQEVVYERVGVASLIGSDVGSTWSFVTIV